MSIKELLDPILDQGIRHTNFFEGRLLTGEDLRNQQEANRQHDRRLGRAIGPGIIEGLEVELLHDGSDGESPTVRVSKGLAINRDGDILGLPKNDITVALTEPREPPKWDQADFYTCAGPPGMQHLPNGAGVYVLVMSPVASYKEQALKSGLSDNGIAKGCGRKFIQEGVEFRLVEATLSFLSSTKGISAESRNLLKDNLLNQIDPATRVDVSRVSLLRNVFAHMCFGTELKSSFAANPLGDLSEYPHYLSYGVVDELHKDGSITSCDVPLCAIYWSLLGIEFIDLWAVRRTPWRVFDASNGSVQLPSRRDVESMSVLLQFQSQLEWLLGLAGNTIEIRASDYFQFIPPVGIIKVFGLSTFEGFDVPNFFHGRDLRGPLFVEGDRIASMIKDSFVYDAIATSAEEMIWLYTGRDNALETAGSKGKYVIFASAFMDYYADARFDVSRWDFSNYSSIAL